MITNENTPDFEFDDLFGEDYLYFYEQSFPAERNRREADAVWQLLALAPGQTVLDLGCGHGRISNVLAERGVRVTGLDASDYFLDPARKDAASRGLDVRFVRGDMSDVPSEGACDVKCLRPGSDAGEDALYQGRARHPSRI